MPDDSVEVRITANTADFSGAIRQASQEANSAFTGMRASAADMASALRAAGGDLSKITPEMLGIGGAATAASSGVKAFETASSASRAATAGMGANLRSATVEFRALFDELSSGRIRYLPSTLAIIGQRVLGLNPAALGAAAGVGALAAGFGYLAFQAMKAAEASRAALSVAAFANLTASREQIQGFVDAAAKLPGATEKDAEEVVATFERMKNANAPLIQAMIDQVGLFATATGEKLPQAAKQLAQAFGDPIREGDKFLETVHATRAEMDAFDQALQRGDIAGAVAVMLVAWAEATERVERATHAATEEQRAAVETLTALGAAEMGAVQAGDQLQRTIQGIDTSKIAQTAKDIAAATTATKAQIGPTGAPIEAVREQVAEIRASWTGLQTDLLRTEIQTWQQRIAIGDLKGKDLLEAERALAQARAQLNREELAQNQKMVQQEVEQEDQANKLKLQGIRDHQIARLQLQAEETRAAAQRGDIDAQAEVARLTEIEAQKYAIRLQSIQDEYNGSQQTVVDEQRAANDRIKAWDDYQAAVERIIEQVPKDNKKSADEISRVWQQAIAPIGRAFDGMTQGILMGTQTWQQAMSRAFDNVAVSFVEDVGKMIAEWAAFKTATAFGFTGLATAIGNPFSGGLFGNLLSFDVGAWKIPHDMVAMIHQGEMILPADVAEMARGGNVPAFSMNSPVAHMLSADGAGLGATINVNFQVQAIDTQTGANFIKSQAPTIANVIASQVRNLNLKPAPGMA